MEDKMLERVRALLAKAQGAATDEEAEAYTIKATELMAKYGIDKALASARQDKREKPDHRFVNIDNPWANRKATLFYNILLTFNCDAVRISRGSKTQLHVFGFEADLQVAEMLFTSLLLQGEHAALRARKPANVHGRSFMTAFWAGFVNETISAVNQAYAKAKEEVVDKPGTDLVLYDRKQEVANMVFLAHPNAKATKVYNKVNRDGYYAGQEAGRNVNVHARKATGTGRRAIG